MNVSVSTTSGNNSDLCTTPFNIDVLERFKITEYIIWHQVLLDSNKSNKEQHQTFEGKNVVGNLGVERYSFECIFLKNWKDHSDSYLMVQYFG